MEIFLENIKLIHIHSVCGTNCNAEHVSNNNIIVLLKVLDPFLCFPDSHLCASECHPFVFLFQVKSLVFDQSGTYLAVGGSDIRVYICKQWSEVLNFTGGGNKSQPIVLCYACHSYVNKIFDLFSSLIIDHTGLVTGVAFGENAQFLTSAGMDRSLKFYSL